MPSPKESQPHGVKLHGKERSSDHAIGGMKPEARLCLDLSYPSSIEAMGMLRNAGFKVSATCVSGLFEPELHIGSASYEGMRAIRRLVDHVTNRST